MAWAALLLIGAVATPEGLWREEGALLHRLAELTSGAEAAEVWARIGTWERRTADQLAGLGADDEARAHLVAAERAAHQRVDLSDRAQLPDSLYELGDLQRALGRPGDARAPLSRLVAEFPTHELAIDAANSLADDAFEEGRLAEAVASYEFVRSRPQASDEARRYATYKLAWCRINVEDMTGARELLTQLSTGTDAPVTRQARRDLVVVLARDAAVNSFAATSLVTSTIPEADRRRSLTAYARLIAEAGRDAESVTILNAIERNATTPELASIVGLELDIASRRRDARSLSRASSLAADLAEHAGPATLIETVEPALRVAAATIHGEARAAGDRDGLALAAHLYDQYFRAFDDSEAAYELHHHAGELHRSLKDHRLAERHYSAAVDRDLIRLRAGLPAGRWLSDSALGAIEAAQAIIGITDDPPGTSASSDEEVLAPVEPSTPFSTDEQLLVAACDRFLEALPSTKEAPRVTYRRALLDFRHARYDDAARSLSFVAKAETEDLTLRKHAMRLALESLRRMRRYEEVAMLSGRYAARVSATDPDRKEFTELAEQGWLAESARSEALGWTDDALDRYVSFAAHFPSSPRAATALYNAAAISAGRHRPIEASAFLRQLVDQYPRHELARRATVSLYDHLVTTARFDEAHEVALNLSESGARKDSAEWLEKAITCAQAAGLTTRADDLRRRYIHRHPTHAAASEYTRFRARTASSCPDRLATHREVLALAPRNEAAAAMIDLARVERSCGRAAAANERSREALGIASGSTRADAALLVAEASVDRFKTLRLRPPFAATLRQKLRLFHQTEEELTKVVRMGIAAPAVCALVTSGETLAAFADELTHVTPPKSFSDEEREAFTEQLLAQAQPLVDRSTQTLESALRRAAEAGIQPSCLALATHRLATLSPAKYGARAEGPVPMARASMTSTLDAAHLLETVPDAPFSILVAATSALQEQRPAAALLLARRIEQDEVHSVDAQELIAGAEEALGLTEAAHGRWLRIAQAHPNRTEPPRRLAQLALAIGDVESARPWLQIAHHQSPDDPAIAVNLAFTERALGHIDEARRLLASTLEKTPRNPDALVSMASLLCVDAADPHEGLRMIEAFDALEQTPPDPARWSTLRDTCQALGKEAR